MNWERSPNVANQLMSQIRELQNDVNSLTDERDFHVPEGSSSSELWSILRSQQTLDYSESQRKAQPRSCNAE